MITSSHITNEQVETAYQAYRDHGLPASRMAIRDALIAAFPDQQPAFGKLVVDPGMADEYATQYFHLKQEGDSYAVQIVLQSFVDRHSIQTIKPIAFAASLPIPEPAVVDAKESAWIKFCDKANMEPSCNHIVKVAFMESQQARGAN